MIGKQFVFKVHTGQWVRRTKYIENQQNNWLCLKCACECARWLKRLNVTVFGTKLRPTEFVSFCSKVHKLKKRFCSSSSDSSSNKVFVSSFLSAVICCCSGVCPICCVRNTLVQCTCLLGVCVYVCVSSRLFLVQFRLFCPCRDLYSVAVDHNYYIHTYMHAYTRTCCGSSYFLCVRKESYGMATKRNRR